MVFMELNIFLDSGGLNGNIYVVLFIVDRIMVSFFWKCIKFVEVVVNL